LNSRTTSIIKEVRGLFWPWCGVMIAASLPTYYPLGFFLGVPLLASLSFGNEFRHRTFSLLLSQPVDRMKIWSEKLSVMLIAILPVILVSGSLVDFGHARDIFKEAPNDALAGLMVLAGLWLVVTVASATFWTLLSRSTVGGLGLMLVQSAGFAIAFIFVMLASWKVSGGIQLLGIHVWAEYQWLFIISAVFLTYAAAMVWLGRRKLAEFQATGGIPGDNLLDGPSAMPEVLTRWIRCRPAGATLNLIRKELRLLLPLWLLMLLLVLCGICLRLTSWLFPSASETIVILSPLLVVLILLLAPVLAGTLSLGEERTLGVQSWHLTQPVSVRRQWFVKLAMAMFGGLVCTVLVPLFMVAADPLLPGPHFVGLGGSEFAFLSMLSLLSFAGFWCACAVNGTIRALLLVLPVIGILGAATRLGSSLGGRWPRGTLLDLGVSWFPHQLTGLGMLQSASAIWLIVPTLLLAVFQSYRLFRTEPPDSIRTVIRFLTPLAIVALLCGFFFRGLFLGLARPLILR